MENTMARILIAVTVLAALAAAAAAAAATDLTRTPFGMVPSECVHAVPNGAIVDNTETHLVVTHPSGEVTHHERCNKQWVMDGATPRAPQPTLADYDDDYNTDGNGWQVYVKQKIGSASDVITKMTAKWNVCAEPSQEAQTLFAFPGLQNIDWVPPNPQPSSPFDIIQPVMQYGSSAAGAFDAWSMASWYVTLTTDVVYSPLTKVAVGDTLFGNMTRTGADSWYIDTVNTKTNKHTGFAITRSILSAQPWAYITLEVYDVSDCEQYPPPGTKISMQDVQLEVNNKPRAITWEQGTNGQQPPICKASIHWSGNNAEISF